MATGTIIKTRKSLIYHYPINNVSISTSWGSSYSGSVNIPISIPGTIKGALVTYHSTGNQSALTSIDSISTNNCRVIMFRGNSGSATGVITLEVFYE